MTLVSHCSLLGFYRLQPAVLLLPGEYRVRDHPEVLVFPMDHHFVDVFCRGVRAAVQHDVLVSHVRVDTGRPPLALNLKQRRN